LSDREDREGKFILAGILFYCPFDGSFIVIASPEASPFIWGEIPFFLPVVLNVQARLDIPAMVDIINLIKLFSFR
jgi:hypothetical protein